MYNYIEAMKEDIKEYINENVEAGEYYDRDNMEQNLYDDLFCEDSVTGNASGSYTFNTWKAHENIEGDDEAHTYIRNAVEDFCIPAETVAEKFLNEDWEYFDVTIRCYLLGQAITEALDEMENDDELERFFGMLDDEEEGDEE